MKARWFTLIVLFSVVLIIISCSAQQVKQDNQALQDNKGGNNQPEQGPPINNQNNKVKDPIQPNSRQSDQDKYKGVIEEVEKQYQVEEQKKRFESQELYKMALSYYNIQDFEKARELVQKALEKYPGNLDAKQLLDDVNKITTKRSGEF